MRVEALAAYDPQEVVRLARDWHPPLQLSRDPMDPEVDFWTEAWTTALRYLKDAGAVPPLEGGWIPRPLEIVRRGLFDPPPGRFESWQHVVEAVFRSQPEELAILGRAEFSFDLPVGEERLYELVGGADPAFEQLWHLRVLKGRRCFSDSGRTTLRRWLLERWEQTSESIPSPYALALLMDITLDAASDESLEATLRATLASRLARTTSPDFWAPFAYLLAETGWHVS